MPRLRATRDPWQTCEEFAARGGKTDRAGRREEAPMRMLLAVAALSFLATSAFAESTVMTLPSYYGGVPAGYYEVPPAIPPNGCVWKNTVFSDGAILERREQPFAFFRCTRGTWQSFDNFDSAAAGHPLGAPARTQ
jgi:hypothetical protein